MNPKRSDAKRGKGPSFEEALARLEEIVEELEQKDLSLEETLARYEEGSKLVLDCTKRLEEAQQKIKKISGEADSGEDETSSDPGTADRAGEDDDGLPF